MSISNLKFPTSEVKTPAGNIPVRGLSVSNLVDLIRQFDSAIMGIANTSGITKMTAAEVGREILMKTPDLAAALVAAAAGEPDNIEGAKALPLGVQVAILEKSAELTFATEGGVANFILTGQKLLGSMKLLGLIAPTTKNSAIGSGVAESL